MAKCANCGEEYEGKRSTSRYCSAKCRKLAFRQNGKVSVLEENGVSVPNLELCRYCGKSLPALQALRQYPGSCYDCAVQQPRKRSDFYTSIDKPQVAMTDFEREHYRPFDQLDEGEFNPISKPGDAHYKTGLQATRMAAGRLKDNEQAREQ